MAEGETSDAELPYSSSGDIMIKIFSSFLRVQSNDNLCVLDTGDLVFGDVIARFERRAWIAIESNKTKSE